MADIEKKDSFMFSGKTNLKYFRPIYVRHGGKQEESWDKWNIEPDDDPKEDTEEEYVPWDFCFFDTYEKNDYQEEDEKPTLIPEIYLDWAYEDKFTASYGPRLLCNHIRTTPVYVEDEENGDEGSRYVYPLEERFIEEVRLIATNYYVFFSYQDPILRHAALWFYNPGLWALMRNPLLNDDYGA